MSTLARAAAIAWAKKIAADPGVVFLDTETTGLGPDAEVCDIGLVGLDGSVILDALVKPGRPIPPDASRVHGITDAMVADADPWEAVYGRLWELIVVRATVVVYNRDYDLGVINRLGTRLALPRFSARQQWECAMLAFSDFAGVPGRFPGSFKWHKLDDAAAHFGIPPGGHRALADAETARRVVLAMAAADAVATGPPVQAPLLSIPDPTRFTR